MSIEEPMSIEDLVRTATQAGATLVRDIGPMTAPESARRLRRRPRRAARRWRSWAVPLAAAAAVVLVAVALVAIRAASSDAPARQVTPVEPTAAPRYFVVIDRYETASGGNAGSGDLIVGDDVAGQTIAAVRPPGGLRFLEVQGGSDDRTFVVLASSLKASGAPDTWYQLRIAPRTAHPYRLAKLPITLPTSSSAILGYALSPDGRELALESGTSTGGGNGDYVVTLGVYSVSSGVRMRAWTARENLTASPIQQTISWLPGGRQLAFSLSAPSGPSANQLRLLNLAGPGTSLLAASRPVLTVETPNTSASTCWTMHLTPDGGTVLCGTQYGSWTAVGTSAGCSNGALEFIGYSLRGARAVRVSYQYRGSCANGLTDILWTNPSGSSFVGAIEVNLTAHIGKQSGQLGVIANGRPHPLNLPKTISPQDYLTAAF